MNWKDFLKKIQKSISNSWQRKNIQRSSRISYHIIWNVILFFITIGIIGLFFTAGIGAGYFASLVDEENVQTEEEMVNAVYNYDSTTELYFANDEFLSDVRSDLQRDETQLKNISEYVQNAVIATEDQYFETHNGIVPKAILRAVFQEMTNSSTKTGGSTLTQQIIKNQILTNEVSFERKAKEMVLAMRLEHFFDKEQILEAYLNIVPFGRNAAGENIAGVQTAAQGIFGVNADELNLAQAAFIGGLPQSPSYYTPFQNSGGLKNEEGLQPGLTRMKTVLNRMYEAGYISQDEYNEAMDYDIVADFKEAEESVYKKYPFLVNEVQKNAVAVLAKLLAEQDGYSEEDLVKDEELNEQYHITAEREISSNGYRIHSTIDKDIYDVFQKITREYNNYGSDKLARNNANQPIMVENPETGEEEQLVQPVQVGSVLIENNTGRIISFVGGRDYDIAEANHATSVPRPNGSTMKPLAAYGPAMELGKVQPGSVLPDVAQNFRGYNRPPTNYSGVYYGLVTAREALYKSHNISALSVYNSIIDQDPAEQFLTKMGFDSLTEGDHVNLSLTLGATKNGVTVEENTNAYATFGNNGSFVDGYMIDKIETKDGEVIYQHESEPVEVFSPQTSYLMIDMMRDVLSRGTGTAARSSLSNPGVDWAGKTGTSNDYKDTWFVATNPNVTLGSWMGYDYNQSLDDGYSNRNNVYWAKLVNAATEINPELMAPSNRFERPNGIVSRSYCAVSGLLPSDECSKAGLVESDIFNANFVPSKKDYSLIQDKYATIDGDVVLANDDTPEEFIDGDGFTFNPEWLKDMGYDKLSNMKQLTARKSGPWQDIQYPTDDTQVEKGKTPSAPSSLKIDSKKLTWKTASGDNIIGYRIYRASDPEDDNFKRVGSTTDTDFSIPSNDAVYHVTAVDFFGQESKPSKVIENGDFSDDEEEDEEKEEKKNKKEKQESKEKEEKTESNEDSEADVDTNDEEEVQEADDRQENAEDDSDSDAEENEDSED
ncbi:transglycosylase domain-containing protein [Gracilibacillus sp. S3-1-1]|uniref:Transglycosylase domain-containing protein n=1 Tax=Gracilibacillus pellucidus TaxID=3095368 RepID=A0ACC6M9D1_9BACI|nr:transglycosylase domain-containing protein [Gracilibacillus sp. S3-1-1]MDX8047491.1 transglycosylase domain-containing protein [Gracilibacillus sp. S3-1-1]